MAGSSGQTTAGDELNRASNSESWAGWVILTGDRLVVTISDIDTSGGAYGVVTFDGVTVRDHITANGTYTIALQHRRQFVGITGNPTASLSAWCVPAATLAASGAQRLHEEQHHPQRLAVSPFTDGATGAGRF